MKWCLLLTYFDFIVFAVSDGRPTGLAFQLLFEMLERKAGTPDMFLVQWQKLEEEDAVQDVNLPTTTNKNKKTRVFTK